MSGSVLWIRRPKGSVIDPHVIDQTTRLLHESHAPLLAAALNFMAATQNEETTLKRLRAGTSFLGSIDGAIVATGVIYQSVTRREDTPEWFLRGDVAVFAQLAVAPRYQKRGLGAKLIELLEQEARAGRKRYLACDTAEPAHDLVAYYKRRGFSIVTTMRYLDASYGSVILSKDVAP